MCEKCGNINADHPQDESLSILHDLSDQGFIDVVWIYDAFKCNICRRLDGKCWKLKDFISSTKYDAPIFSHSHVGCKCKVVVKNLNGEERIIDFTGLKQSKHAFKPMKKVKKFIDNINPFKKKSDIYQDKDNLIKKKTDIYNKPVKK